MKTYISSRTKLKEDGKKNRRDPCPEVDVEDDDTFFTNDAPKCALSRPLQTHISIGHSYRNS